MNGYVARKGNRWYAVIHDGHRARTWRPSSSPKPSARPSSQAKRLRRASSSSAPWTKAPLASAHATGSYPRRSSHCGCTGA